MRLIQTLFFINQLCCGGDPGFVTVSLCMCISGLRHNVGSVRNKACVCVVFKSAGYVNGQDYVIACLLASVCVTIHMLVSLTLNSKMLGTKCHNLCITVIVFPRNAGCLGGKSQGSNTSSFLEEDSPFNIGLATD